MASHDQSSVGSAPVRQRSKMWQSVRHRIRSPSIKSLSTLDSSTGNLSITSYKDYQLYKQTSIKSMNTPIRKVKNEKPARSSQVEKATAERSLVPPSATSTIRQHPNDKHRTRLNHFQKAGQTWGSPHVSEKKAGVPTRQRSNSGGSFYDRYEQEMTYHHRDEPIVEAEMQKDSPSPSLADQTEHTSQTESFDLLEKLSCVATTQLITDYFSAGKSLYNKTFSCAEQPVDVMDLRYTAGGWLKKAVFSRDLTKQNEDDPTSFSQEYDAYFESPNPMDPMDDTSLYTDDSDEKFSVEQSTLISSIAPSSREDDPSSWQDLAEGFLSTRKRDGF